MQEAGVNGFSITCAVASAAERVIVMMKPVATNPSSTSTKQLALPPGEQPLQHRDRAVAVRALLGHPPVHRQRAEQRDQHQDERRDRRERRRRRARRCPAGSRGSRSSRRRSGTSPSTRGACALPAPGRVGPRDPQAGRRGASCGLRRSADSPSGSHPDGCTHVDWHSVPHDERLRHRLELRIRLGASASC